MNAFWSIKSAGFSLVALALWASLPERAQAGLIGPSPYLAFDNTLPGAGAAISPFSGGSFSYFHLETFEDHLFNVPGVIASAGVLTSTVFNSTLNDSVDADDGVIDGSGLAGDSFFFHVGASGISFTFSAGALGSLPTHAGIVWTDGAGTITFEAFNELGVSLGTLTGTHADGATWGTTGEDRFYGATNPGGISKIFIKNSDGGIEVDHLQYGAAASLDAVPEPASLAIWGLGALGCAIGGYRRRKLA